ncbi:hypothetical protein, partial [Criblamydia sequanensis]|uniref:hypothetical protein n=1 Tax=Candidatus Criblamydia sequanensis TaxID=340071 RepID=UPI0012AB9419
MQSASSVTSQALFRPSFFLRAANSFKGRAINSNPFQNSTTVVCNFSNRFWINKRTSWSMNPDPRPPIWRMYTCTRIEDSLYDVSFESFAAYVEDVAKNELKGSQYFDLRE